MNKAWGLNCIMTWDAIGIEGMAESALGFMPVFADESLARAEAEKLGLGDDGVWEMGYYSRSLEGIPAEILKPDDDAAADPGGDESC